MRFDIIEAGVNTVKNMFEVNPKSVKDYFKNEEKVITEINPFMLTFIVPLYIELAPSYLLGKNIST